MSDKIHANLQSLLSAGRTRHLQILVRFNVTAKGVDLSNIDGLERVQRLSRTLRAHASRAAIEALAEMQEVTSIERADEH